VSSLERASGRIAVRVSVDGIGVGLVRRGTKLSFSVVVGKTKEGDVQVRSLEHRCPSSFRARQIEKAYRELDPLARPANLYILFATLVSFGEHVEGFVREVQFWRERMPEGPDGMGSEVLHEAAWRWDAALRVAYRRCGRRWSPELVQQVQRAA